MNSLSIRLKVSFGIEIHIERQLNKQIIYTIKSSCPIHSSCCHKTENLARQ